MKPYLAVLFDSFLESTRSYVLWILLAAWTLLLALLFPLHFTSEESYQILGNSFRSDSSAGAIMDALAEASAGKGSRAQKVVFSKLPESFQKIMKDRKETKRRVSVGVLIEELNRLLTVQDLYAEDAWPNVKKSDKYNDLLDKENLSKVELEKLNRKLLDSAFPSTLNSPEGRATWVAYAGIKLGNPLPFTKEMAKPFIEQGFYPVIMWIGLSVVMLFISIIITSSLIPDLFQPGSLHLLLSKPISRSLLFLTKYIGGCIFVGLNVTFVLVGLYLYSGFQLDIWNEGILKCIPLFIFSFLVYYAVSCLAGLIWRNAIISVVVTALFWALCFVLGLVYSYFQYAVELKPSIRGIQIVNESIWARSMSGRLLCWDKTTNRWQSAFGERDDQRLLGPVAIASQKSLYFARTENLPFGLGGRENMRMDIAKIPDAYDPKDETFSSPQWADGRLDSGSNLPKSAEFMIPWGDTLAVMTPNGLFIFDPSKDRPVENRFEGITNVLQSFGVQPQKEDAFKHVIKDIDLARPFDWAVSQSRNTVIAYSKGDAIVWKLDSETGEYSETWRKTFDFDKELVTTVGCNDSLLFICPEGLTPIVVDLKQSDSIRKLDQIGEKRVRQILNGPKNEIVLVDYERNVWLLNESATEIQRPNLTGQGEALSATFADDGKLWVAYRVSNVAAWDLSGNTVAQVLSPRSSLKDLVYYWFMKPMYMIAQRPAEMEDLQEVLVKNASKSMAVTRSDMDEIDQEMETGTSILSNMIFVSVILAICCLYLYRQDL
jgi:ABC-type transport system involved in multi-copper enzyme maturation permease subunit